MPTNVCYGKTLIPESQLTKQQRVFLPIGIWGTWQSLFKSGVGWMDMGAWHGRDGVNGLRRVYIALLHASLSDCSLLHVLISMNSLNLSSHIKHVILCHL
jgi:hypothetical protein